MNIILTTGILLIIMSLIFRKKWPPYWGMILVFLIMGFQDGVDTDYIRYKENWHEFATYSEIQSRTADSELLWNAICYYLSPIMPFWLFIMLTSAFECWILWLVGKKYGSKVYGWIGPILFFFTFYMMLIEMSAIRQALAVGFCVMAYYLTDKRNGLSWSIIMLVFAYLIHNSAVIAFPFVLLQIIILRNSKISLEQVINKERYSLKFPIIMLISYLLIYILKEKSLGGWLTELSYALGSNFRLAGYLVNELEHQFDISWLIIMYNGIMVFLSSWFMQRTTKRYRILAIASIIGCYLDMLLFGIGALHRISTFFIIYNIFVYPKLIEMIEQKFGKKYASLLIVFLIGYAIKTSLPMIMDTKGVFPYANYHFVFMD